MVKRTVGIVLLVKNELEPMKEIIPRIDRSVVDDIFCMDGHSTDGSIEYLEGQGIRVVQQRVMGRGNAVTESITKSDADYLLCFSPDGNEDSNDIPIMIQKMHETGAALVIARRFGPHAQSDDSDDRFYIRKIGNLFYSLMVRIFWGGKIWDAINGLRLVNRRVLGLLNQDVAGHQIEIQQTIRCLKLGLRIEEIPTIEAVRVGGIRKSPTWKMGIQFVRLLLDELLLGRRFLYSSREKSKAAQ